MKFLIIDTKTTRRHDVQNVFLRLGCLSQEIRGTSSADEGLNFIKENEYSAVFLYPDDTAYKWIKLLETVREIHDYNALPVIIFSDTPTKDQVVEAYDAGANGFLKYPCGDENFSKVIDLIKHPPTKKRRNIAVF